MRNLTVGGRIIRVSVREGTAGWPPLLLCNGIGASLEAFQPFVDALGPQRPVIRFDMPGVGGSPAPVIPYHLHTSAPLLAGLLDQLGYGQADVLGISWGGGLAQQFALSRQDRVRRLVLVATGTGALMVPGNPRVLLRMLTPRRHRDPGYTARIAGDLYGGSARQNPDAAPALSMLARRVAPLPLFRYHRSLLQQRALVAHPLVPRLVAEALLIDYRGLFG
jgi:pimeloyl-ACP methyl ester carboxylesterase